MQTLRTTSPRQQPLPAPPDSPPPTPFVAVGALLLQPRDRDEPVSTIVDRGPWPLFVIVLDDRAAVDRDAGPLFDLLDRPHANRIPMASSRYRWSVDPSGKVLKLALRIHEPTKLNLDIVMPARSLLGVISQLPAEVTFAITTKQHADKLTERVRIRDALHEMVLLVSPALSGNPHDGLAELRRNGQSPAEPPQRQPVDRITDLCL
jgi:hypothetical protein